MRRLLALAAVLLLGALFAPGAALARPDARGHAPEPLPAHGVRPVCAPPAHGTASCASHVVTRANSATPLATSSYQYGYRPVDLQAAYQLPSASGSPGTGPTVAIVDAYDNPNAASDLSAYRSQFNLGTCGGGCFSKVNQAGGTSYPKGDTGWGAEIDLDIEMVSAACPTCKILLVEANSNSFSDLMTAVSYATAHAAFVSNSYGGGEFSGETNYDSNFNKPGVGITVSSGDSGYGVEYPAASRYVTAVGGTSLTQSSGGWSETAWSGAGSGCSAVEPKPAWQSDSGCSRRTVADVSAVADPNTGVAVYDSYGSSGGANWFVYGGTSVAAPLVAGIWALAGALPNGTTAGQVPYLHLNGWDDVTSGTNSHHCGSGYLCQAVVGYDGPTGLGTPIGASGFGGTVGGGGGGTTNNPPTASFTYSCTNLSCTFTDASTDTDGTIASRSWTFGDGGTSTAQNPTHSYASGGTFTVTLTVTDDGGATGTTSKQVTVSASTSGFSLTATGYKVKGRNTVDLVWGGASGSVDVYRDGNKITTAPVTGTSYTDSTGQRGGATYSYQVCNAGTNVCSNTATVVF
jgi:PKD repeat protein